MRRSRPSEDPARRWRQFCRAGGRWAVLFAALWFGGLAFLFRIAPAPAAAYRAAPARLSGWWSAPGGAALDVRAQWTPAAFALSTPAGFSHSLRGARAGLAPPIQAERLPAAYLDDARTFAPLDAAEPGRLAAEARAVPGAAADAGVFPPRAPAPESARLVFPEGWESRLFSGIDLDYPQWTKAAWEARVEMRFDGNGVPESILLAQASGVPEVDRRLARSASGWRLLEPAAPRAGVVAWKSPAAAAGGAP